MRRTHTVAVLEISKAAFDEIAQKLRKEGYDHAFVEEFIDMSGIAVAAEADPVRLAPGADGRPNIKTMPDGATYFDFSDGVHETRLFSDDVQRP